MLPRNVVAFGPSLVDIYATLSPAQHSIFLRTFAAQAGDWIPLETSDQIEQALFLSTGEVHLGTALQDASRHARIAPGSSLLNILGALPAELRSTSILVTAQAVHAKTIDPLAILFDAAVQKLGLQHYQQTIEGYNPFGVIVTSTHSTEKTMAMCAGVASDLAPYDLPLNSTNLVVIDAYELRTGKLAAYLDTLITSGKYTVILSLGNQSILHGSLQKRLHTYIKTGKITILCGNQAEYQCLFPEISNTATDKDMFAEHPVQGLVPHVLITYGEGGMAAQSNGVFASADRVLINPDAIINTAGAGDTAAGTFLAGLLQSLPLKEVLAQATEQSARTLTTQSGLVA